jgi:hypothetical protein
MCCKNQLYIYIYMCVFVCVYVCMYVVQLPSSDLRFDFILLLCRIYYLYSIDSDMFFFSMVKCGSRSRQLGLMPVNSNSHLSRGFNNFSFSTCFK